MISGNDVIEVEITPDEFHQCMDNPVQGCTRRSTGQLKALGNLAMRKVLGLSEEEFTMQQDAAQELGAAYVCEVRRGNVAGIVPTVSVVHDDDILRKRLVVPANQLYKNAQLNSHYTVGVFVHGNTNDAGELVDCQHVYVAGWVHTNQLKRWVKRGGTPPFTVRNASLAVAPTHVLLPMHRLLSEVKWKKYCV